MCNKKGCFSVKNKIIDDDDDSDTDDNNNNFVLHSHNNQD